MGTLHFSLIKVQRTYAYNVHTHYKLNKMSELMDNSTEKIDVILPRQGLLYQEANLDYILCKPKLIPLKSVTLEKLEKMQKDAELKIKEAEEHTETDNNE
ncbi:BBSome-interacting protein 1 isoform X1 [Ceratina calcarata]|uniref:BBSome-interacting protein 1 isoform X1 n=1 Tax=Ceratina calcarata TaxID=156304 RepID=A0AAJ7RY98_9HYME|nr:BBSome-interacting protein 1 isoform X1 [Ceratina calcarata]